MDWGVLMPYGMCCNITDGTRPSLGLKWQLSHKKHIRESYSTVQLRTFGKSRHWDAWWSTHMHWWCAQLIWVVFNINSYGLSSAQGMMRWSIHMSCVVINPYDVWSAQSIWVVMVSQIIWFGHLTNPLWFKPYGLGTSPIHYGLWPIHMVCEVPNPYELGTSVINRVSQSIWFWHLTNPLWLSFVF